MPSTPSLRDDDVELPPLDADEDDAPVDEEHDVELRDDPLGDDPLDDAEAHDLDAGVEVDDTALTDPGGSDDEDGVDVGALDEGIDFTDEPADDGEGLDDPDDDGDDLDDDADDGGAEGTDDAPEDEVDEHALPALDADEEGADDGELAEALFAEATMPASFADGRWESVEGAGADVPCAAVAAFGGRVIAGGEALLVGVGLGAARAATSFGAVSAVALADGVLAFATARGQVLWAPSLDELPAPLGGWRTAIGGVELAATPGRIFLVADGALWSFTATGERLASLRASGVRAIAAAGGVVACLARTDDGGISIELYRGDDESLPAVRLEGDAGAVALGDPVALAVASGGKALALGDGRTVVVSRDGGATFAALAVGGASALAFAGDGPAAPLVIALEPDPDGTAALVRVSASGEATRIGDVANAAPAELDDDATLARSTRPGPRAPVALAWDAAEEALWIASRAGLQAFRGAAKH